MKQRFDIKGMTCAACASHVSKAAKSVDGVSDVEVNLLTNTMDCNIDDSKRIDEINMAIKKAGYESNAKGINSKNFEKEENKIKPLIIRLIFSIIFLIPLFYLSMGFMMHFYIFNLDKNPLILGLILMILSAIIMLLNKRFYISGFKALINRSPNMDTLVALGSMVSFIYAIVILFIMAYYKNDDHMIMKYAMNLTFETAGMVPTLISIGKMLEEYSKGKTTNALKSLMNLAPKEGTIIKDGKEVRVKASDIKIGDIFIVKAGDSIPVDGKIIDGISSVDENMLTGESMPVDKTIGDNVYSGTINLNGILKCEAKSVGEDTSLSKIIKMVYDLNQTKPKIQRLVDKVAAIFVPVVMLISLLAFTYWFILGNVINLDINETILTYAINRAVMVLVISCPCALGLATPVAIMVGSGLSFKNGILFKNALSIENIKDAKYVILDKTGTITMGKPKVYSIVPFIDQAKFLSIIKSLEENSSHPLASAINEYKCSYEKKEVKDFKEIGGKGVSGIIDNKLAYGINLKYAKELINIDDSKLEIINDIAQSGKTPLIFILDNELIGIVAVADKIKEDSKTAIKNLKELGLIPIMLTGDNYITASSIAKEVEIDYFISDVLPIDKKDIVEKIKKNGSTIMVGDGINDALALTSADIGIAIGAGSDIAIDSADIVLVKSSLNDLVKTIRISREIVKNIKQNLFWAFFYNLIMIPIAFGIFYFTNNEYLVSLKPWYGALAMSFSSIFVVLNALRLNLFDANKHKNNRKIKEEDLLFIKNVITNKEENNMEKIVINVNGMMCMHCKKHVEDACLKIDGVSEANADLDKKNVTVSITKNVAREDLVKSIIDAGYEAK